MSGLWVLVLLIFVSSIPLIAVFIWFRFARYPFSIYRFLFALLAGAAAVFPALILQNFFFAPIPATGKWSLFFQIFISIALTEELSRFLMLFILFWISSRYAATGELQIQHGAASGLIAGFGFAVIEGAIYGASDTGVLLLRVFTAAPLHGACGYRVGTAAVLFRSNPYQANFRFLTATAIHGIYNFMIVMPGLPSFTAILIALSALASSILSIRNGWKNSDNQIQTTH